MPTLASPGRLNSAYGRGSAAAEEEGETDPLIANVELILEFEGEDAATETTDASGNARTITFNGAAQIDTAQADVGSSSAAIDLADDSGDSVTTPAIAGDLPGTGPFCFEISIRPTSNVFGHGIAALVDAAETHHVFTFGYTPSSSTLFLWLSPEYDEYDATSVDLSVDTWYKLCFERDDANVLRIYVDGAVVFSQASVTTDLSGSPETLGIGTDSPSGGASLHGHIDHVRWTVGAHRHGGAYTPSTDPFPTS